MSRAGRPAGRRAAAQLRLPVGTDAEPNSAELEAELLALVGKPEGGASPAAVVPMEAIERMAALCMRDPGEEEEEEGDDEDPEGEEELMAELQEVLGDGGGGSESPDPPTQGHKDRRHICPKEVLLSVKEVEASAKIWAN